MNIFDIARLSEWRTLYRATKSSINNGTAPSLTRAILRCDLLTWQLRRPYTHRNGEMQPPTVPGKYWFRGRMFVIDNIAVLTNITQDERGALWALMLDNDGDCYEPLGLWVGQWWGPLVAPWELGQ